LRSVDAAAQETMRVERINERTWAELVAVCKAGIAQ